MQVYDNTMRCMVHTMEIKWKVKNDEYKQLWVVPNVKNEILSHAIAVATK